MIKNISLLNIILACALVFFSILLVTKFTSVNKKSTDYNKSSKFFQEEAMQFIDEKFAEYLIDDTYLPGIQGNVIYCYIESIDCGSCVQGKLLDFFEIGKVIGKSHLGIISNFIDTTSQLQFSRKYSIENVVQENARIKSLVSILPNKYFFFFLDSLNIVRDAFIPIYDQKMNMKYFEKIIIKRIKELSH
ncbi:hypothetical protein D4R99_00240 [bacterium]|nr:MAG: hypothetical protein D4R99_00240 [bacterium]